MEKDKVPEPIEEIPLVATHDTIVELQKDIKNLIVKYNNDMTTLNRILSTYEDELSSLKSQFFDLSFKLKQMTQQSPKSE